MSLTTGEIRLAVYGHPAPQGSKKHVGKGVMIESSKFVKPWRDDVRAAIDTWLADRRPWEPIDGPIAVRMVFTVRKPASAPKTRRTWPMRTPDLSKLARSTEDALTDSGLIKDDARLVEYARLAKVFPNEDPEALEAPGVTITLYRIDMFGAVEGVAA